MLAVHCLHRLFQCLKVFSNGGGVRWISGCHKTDNEVCFQNIFGGET